MRTITTNVYTFDELDDDAKERARAWWREGAPIDLDFVLEDAKTVASLLGIEIDDIFYSVGGGQGDGAVFVGSYKFKPRSKAGVSRYAPGDTQLADIADALASAQKRNARQIEANVSHHDSRYFSPKSTEIDVSRADNRDLDDDAEETVVNALHEFMDWIHSMLDKQYEWEMSDEAVDENLIANEYEFDETGRRVLS